MSETLFNIARANMSAAYRLLKTLTDDPRDLNIIGYHLQQAVEIALKYVLESAGDDYPKSHAIATLYIRVEEIGSSGIFSDTVWESLYVQSETFTIWEAQTRYIKDWFVELGKIERGFYLVNDLLEELSSWSGDTYTVYTWPLKHTSQREGRPLPPPSPRSIESITTMNLSGGDSR